MLTFRRECPIVLAILSGLLIGTAHPGGAVINGTPDGTACHESGRHCHRSEPHRTAVLVDGPAVLRPASLKYRSSHRRALHGIGQRSCWPSLDWD